jgi:hypothetical protein
MQWDNIAFAKACFCEVVFDNRRFGDREGEPWVKVVCDKIMGTSSVIVGSLSYS